MRPEDLASVLLRVLLPIFLLLLGWGVGTAAERAHLRRLRRGENRWRRLPVLSVAHAPESWRIDRAGLVSGSVVISIDHWKRLGAWLRGLVGGRVRGYESLLERARREALLRLKAQAHAAGFDAVVGLRLESTRLATARADGKGTAGVEVLAFGTGLARR